MLFLCDQHNVTAETKPETSDVVSAAVYRGSES